MISAFLLISTIPFTTKYVDDSSLASGKEVVKQKGANGLVTETYMTKMQNGKIISNQLLSRDTYSAMQRIINRGITKSTNNENVTEQQTENKEVEEEKTTESVPETKQDSVETTPETTGETVSSEQ